jgi:hypothetical protein
VFKSVLGCKVCAADVLDEDVVPSVAEPTTLAPTAALTNALVCKPARVALAVGTLGLLTELVAFGAELEVGGTPIGADICGDVVAGIEIGGVVAGGALGFVFVVGLEVAGDGDTTEEVLVPAAMTGDRGVSKNKKANTDAVSFKNARLLLCCFVAI